MTGWLSFSKSEVFIWPYSEILTSQMRDVLALQQIHSIVKCKSLFFQPGKFLPFRHLVSHFTACVLFLWRFPHSLKKTGEDCSFLRQHHRFIRWYDTKRFFYFSLCHNSFSISPFCTHKKNRKGTYTQWGEKQFPYILLSKGKTRLFIHSLIE